MVEGGDVMVRGLSMGKGSARAVPIEETSHLRAHHATLKHCCIAEIQTYYSWMCRWNLERYSEES